MKQKYVIDTTALMSYFSSTFEIQNKMSQHALDIISQAFNNDSIILLIPSIVFVEIFSKQFTKCRNVLRKLDMKSMRRLRVAITFR